MMLTSDPGIRPTELPEPPSYPALSALIGALRKAHAEGRTSDAVDEAIARIRTHSEQAAVLRTDIRRLFADTQATHLLTEAGVLSDEGLVAGTIRRLARRVAPTPPRENPLEYAAGLLLEPKDIHWVKSLCPEQVRDWIEALCTDDSSDWGERMEVASAAVILATRISGAGMDHQLVERLPELEEWNSPFLELSRVVGDYAVSLVTDHCSEAAYEATLEAVRRCLEQVNAFRARKERLGTTMHLSSRSLRMLQQLRRLRQLVLSTRASDEGALAVAELCIDLLRALCRPHPIRDFAREKVGLLAYLAVGRAAQKGDKYVCQSRSEYAGFLKKSLLGGVLVAIFAVFKLHLSHEGLAAIPQAFIYGLNYAICFVLIYLFGATLATKQPALTASRLAEALEDIETPETFARLVRSIWQSQFISFVGNILGAMLVATGIGLLFPVLFGAPLIDNAEAVALAQKHAPLSSGALWYAAVAGVLLSSAGFLAGWVDNAVVFHRVGDRVAAGTGVFRFLRAGPRRRLADRVDHTFGAVTGNVALGFMLGSAGAFGEIVGLPIDIRHIAFSSSHTVLAVLHAEAIQTAAWIATLLAAVVLIGLINFVVSFGLTLWVAVAARDVQGLDWTGQLRSVGRLIRQHPIEFFVPLPERQRPN